ncbi:hypothetical protein IEI94_20280 [Halomonas sp. ML-15]|uniref:hypothetical protein n=1 Tax=Halomonas sp. ML-15 TaxID=2773305 RepID=UPI0017464955|nr:hypothetical protein [Halomonas sp. ML-15]MBD3898196.1 hypothetical protein [Halomonas sp. ML-15]
MNAHDMLISLAPVLSGLVTGAVALLVLWRTNLSNERRTERQIIHDDRVRSRDLKSTIYAQALEAIDECFGLLTNLHKEHSLEGSGPDDFCQKKMICLARIPLVADEEIHLVATSVRKELIMCGFNIYNYAVPIHEMYDEINEIKKDFDRNRSDLAEIRNARNLSGATGVVDWRVNIREDELLNRLKVVRERQEKYVKEYLEKIDEMLVEPIKKRNNLVALMRSDVELGYK